MKLAKLSLIAAVVLGGLLACSNIASAQDNGTNAAPGGKKGKRMTLEQRMEHLSTELKLTDEQKPKVKTALEDTEKKMRDLRGLAQDERQDKMKSIMEAQNKKMKEILTDEQYSKYEKMNQRGGKKKKSESSTQ